MHLKHFWSQPMLGLSGPGIGYLCQYHRLFFLYILVPDILLKYQAMRVIINDRRYGALKTLGERKQVFNEVNHYEDVFLN